MIELERKREEFLTYLSHLRGLQFTHLKIPVRALSVIEPSQIGTIVGTLVDAMIPSMDDLGKVGLKKHPGILKDREAYPDFIHSQTKFRAELKLLYSDNMELDIKRPKTKREPSARVSQKVTMRNISEDTDFLLIVVYELQTLQDDSDSVSPTIIDLDIIPMDEIIVARDARLIDKGGKWFGDYQTPVVLSKIGQQKRKESKALNENIYGRKAQEGHDYNEDTNFGKLNRIPHVNLISILKKYGYKTADDDE